MMISNYLFLLLVVVLSAYPESPQHVNLPYSFPIAVAVYQNSSSAQLGVFTPVRPQNEVSINPPQYEVSLNPPQYEVSINPPQYEVSNLPQYEAFISPPHYEVYKIALPQNEVFETVLPQLGGFEIATVNCQLFNRVKNILSYVLNLGVKGIKHLTSALTHGGGKLGWAIRILLECLQHVLKMYTWFLSWCTASIHFRCRLTSLLSKKSLFRKHDFAAWVYRLYHCYQNLVFQHLKIFLVYRFGSCAQIREEHFKISNQFHFYGGGKSLIFSSDELLPYALADLQEQQYQFLQCVKKDNKQSIVLGDGDIFCSVPLNMLTPKLTLKTAKELALLHGIQKFYLKMHRVCFKITNVILVMTSWLYSTPIRFLLMLNIRKHGTRKIQKNVLSMISIIIISKVPPKVNAKILFF